MSLALTMAAAVSLVTGVRWLRVAQREHYLAPAVSRFAWRWWTSSGANIALALLGLIGVVGVWWRLSLGWLAMAAAVGPLGFSWPGTTSKMVWTARLRRLAVIAGVPCLIAVIASLLSERPGWALASLAGLPVLIDVSLAMAGPLEKVLGEKWVTRAEAKLKASGARVVAITGSYGKTTTKGYLSHLLAGKMPVVVSPASFNNRMGLARAINEQLTPGTAVFIAEMGTYGPREIAELCRFVPPEVSVITALGPVHLERFGSEESILEAKREILDGAKVSVLAVDHPLLAGLAVRQADRGPVIRCSGTDATADVAVVNNRVSISGRQIGEVDRDVFASNLACAIAVALYLGVQESEISERLQDLPVAPHRRQITRSEAGLVVIDDTYNSNPAGATEALRALMTAGVAGRKVVVTPGIVEMGRIQFEENRKLAKQIATFATDLVVVGKTNRLALMEGSEGGAAVVTVVESRPEAVEWVRAHLGPGDAVLYENDLPDHYP
jgi:UDP-N-acetylmuramoyl-tripeptide--D-alanyl-D-alanine ligase